MATKRHVKRAGAGGRQAIVKSYSTRAWYELPDWAQQVLTENIGRIVLAITIILTPAVLLGLVIGAHSLPLEFLGVVGWRVAGNANGVGVAALVFLLKFTLLALAVRPLMRRERKGWHFLIGSAAVHMIHSFVLRHGISGAFLFFLVIYLYTQLKDRFK